MTEYVFGIIANLPLTAATAASASAASKLEEAGVNTLLGMGMAFAVLILISLVISLFPLIGRRAERKPAPAPAAPAPAPAAVEEEDLTDDAELVAVIAAAIAAYEGSSTTEGFQVRSIRKSRTR